jgi:hypothetical protein
MKQHKHNRWIILFLSTVSLGVWGLIFYQIISGISHKPDQVFIYKKEDRTNIKTRIPAGYQDSLFNHTSNLRNPFQRPLPKSNQKATIKNIKEQVQHLKIPPPIKYIGFITDAKGNLALLEFSHGETLIGREGDIIQNIKLDKISKEAVQVMEDGNMFILPLYK